MSYPGVFPFQYYNNWISFSLLLYYHRNSVFSNLIVIISFHLYVFKWWIFMVISNMASYFTYSFNFHIISRTFVNCTQKQMCFNSLLEQRSSRNRWNSVLTKAKWNSVLTDTCSNYSLDCPVGPTPPSFQTSELIWVFWILYGQIVLPDTFASF